MFDHISQHLEVRQKYCTTRHVFLMECDFLVEGDLKNLSYKLVYTHFCHRVRMKNPGLKSIVNVHITVRINFRDLPNLSYTLQNEKNSREQRTKKKKSKQGLQKVTYPK